MIPKPYPNLTYSEEDIASNQAREVRRLAFDHIHEIRRLYGCDLPTAVAILGVETQIRRGGNNALMNFLRARVPRTQSANGPAAEEVANG